ncbi:MAG TPA: hypothetical protein VI702_03000 [Nitrospiria bacterium]
MRDSFFQSSLFEIEPAFSWPEVVTSAALEAVAGEKGQVIAFFGHRGLLALGHYLMAWRLLQDESIILVDGANIIDLPLILRFARGFNRNRRELLNRIHLSRAFTLHQLEACISERLEEALKKYSSRLCFVSGFLDAFYNEEVPFREAARILDKTAKKLRALADQGHRVIVLAPDPPMPTQRKSLAPGVIRAADRTFSLVQEKDRCVLMDDTQTVRKQNRFFPSMPFPIRRTAPR